MFPRTIIRFALATMFLALHMAASAGSAGGLVLVLLPTREALPHMHVVEDFFARKLSGAGISDCDGAQLNIDEPPVRVPQNQRMADDAGVASTSRAKQLTVAKWLARLGKGNGSVDGALAVNFVEGGLQLYGVSGDLDTRVYHRAIDRAKFGNKGAVDRELCMVLVHLPVLREP